MRGATKLYVKLHAERGFQSTRPMRGATHGRQCDVLGRVISIHAPHAGRDHVDRQVFAGDAISIHAPHAGRDITTSCRVRRMRIFQSTGPMRGATFPHIKNSHNMRISIHAPHAGRDEHFPADYARIIISIHAPHAGRDVSAFVALRFSSLFQSTRPMRGATPACIVCVAYAGISIHAPHAGRDLIFDFA